jgi:type VI secretion system protein ImpK
VATPVSSPLPSAELSSTCDLCLATALQLRDAADLGAASQLRSRIKSQLDGLATGLRRAGLSENDVSDSLFAVVALIDETISLSSWAERDGWLANPLQLEMFGRFDAGDQFFTKLTSLSESFPHRRSVLEMYFYCLCLGFQGKYQLLDRTELDSITDNLRRQLLGPSPEKRPLSPQGIRQDKVEVLPPEGVPIWVVWAAAGLLAFLAYLFFRWRSSANAGALQNAIERAALFLAFIPRSAGNKGRR